ncbi:MAG TPA: Trp family transcriptional regulator [Candidatus Paceibacterota bacterium]
MVKQRKEREGEKEGYVEELLGVIREIAGDKNLLKAFFQDILSPAEYKELGVRWQIVKQLAAGKSQRDVAKNLHTAIATVTRGSRELADKEGGFQQVLKKN